MENHYGRSPLKEAMDKINAQEKRNRIINRSLYIVSMLLSIIAITISLLK